MIYVALININNNVQTVKSKSQADNSYGQILAKTQGIWKTENWNKLSEKRSKIELESSKKRKKSW